MSYTVQNNKVYRGDEAIADVVGDEIDFYEGMARFRAPAMRMFNQWNSKNEATDVDDIDAPADDIKPDAAISDAGDSGVQVSTDKNEGDEKPKQKVEKKKVKKSTIANKDNRPQWLIRLSEIVGVELPMPHSKDGWRRSSFRELLQKNYQLIIKDAELNSFEKKGIVNYFI